MNPTWILLLSLYANPQPSLQIPEPAHTTPGCTMTKRGPSGCILGDINGPPDREYFSGPDPDYMHKVTPNLAPNDKGKIDPGANIRVPSGTINLTMTPPGPGDIPVNKMTGVEADTRVYVPSAVQVPFPSKDGCEAAAKAAEKVGKGVCLEVR